MKKEPSTLSKLLRIKSSKMGALVSEEERKLLERLRKRNPNPLEEDEVKDLLQKHLEGRGWRVEEVKWGQEPGIDVLATRSGQRWIIEAKGWADGKEPQQGNYFGSALSELLQRMDDEKARYSLAFPDLPRYRGLWDRLPALAKRRAGIDCLFVDISGNVIEE